MVDYSKWDKLDISDGEEELKRKPRVHRLEGSHSVTIGGKDGIVELRPSDKVKDDEDEDQDDSDQPMEVADDDVSDAEDTREDVLQCRALAERALQRGDAEEGIRLLEKALKLAGDSDCPGLKDLLESARKQHSSSKGRTVLSDATPQAATATDKADQLHTVGDRYAWSQTKDSVQVNVFVPEGTKSKDVKVNVSDVQVSIETGGKVYLSGSWEFKVEPEEDPDWELKELNGRRVVRLSVRKATVPGGYSVVVWWTRVLKGDEAIDVNSIEERNSSKSRESNDRFAKAWNEAHAQFRENIKHRKPVLIDVSGNQTDDVEM